jgi:hypothetical protein
MTRIFATAGVFLVMGACLAVALPQTPVSDASPTRFVGDWVGLQTWAIADPPVNARDPQPVEIKIESVDGRLVGTLTPFMGGSDGASFVDAVITGEELKASGAIGPPRLATAQGGRGQRGATGWKAPVKVDFNFTATGNSNQLTGTADVWMGAVKWTKFKYELNRKRSRY